ncbi:hypothetical protein Micbo1qcDRAFT_71353 [Microdochium bolleyi]|uniref:CMP/dCMP-type deaminase domain-containing protein n=1 Tax=Microdochium bolleyi TaxID=196109 RepID=A0A136J073_9PEZI|nr:hypothetical protein Micbo1qcDRAFT_71353 [Microdochium bolleyi]
MADDANPQQHRQRQPESSTVVRFWQALVVSVVHLFARIFHSSSQASHSTTQPQQDTHHRTPQHQQQQQDPDQIETQPAPTPNVTDADTAATGNAGSDDPDALSRGQTIRRVPLDFSLESNEEPSHASRTHQASEDKHEQDGVDDEMAGGRGRGGRGGGRGGYERPSSGQPYRNRSTHSQHSQHSTYATGGTNGFVGTAERRAHSPAYSSPTMQGPRSRPVSAGSSASVTRAPGLGQGSTNGANGSVHGGKNHEAGHNAAAAAPAAVVPKVKLPPSKPISGKVQGQDLSAQKENRQPGYTNAASHQSPAPVANSTAESGTLAEDQKPKTSQDVPALQQVHNDTTEASKPAGEDVPLKLPTPIIVPLPYTMKPIPPKLLGAEMPGQILPGLVEPKTPEERIEREYHLKYMRAACDMGQLALETNETPVGCVLVWNDQIIAKGMNATNITRNGTRHAEFMALSALLSREEKHETEDAAHDHKNFDESSWDDVDPKDGHVFPYGQKLHPAPVVSRSIVSECTLYVTVEPCVMCASLLRQLRIKKVYFGAVNDKFGGTGGVFRIHMNSKPVPRPTDRPYQNGYGPAPVEKASKNKTGSTLREDDDGDGGNVEPGFPAEGGYMRDEAVSLLRRFYVQENGRAPQPRKKEGRAARLFAMEAEAQALKSSASEMSDGASAPQTPADAEVKEFPQSAAGPQAPDAAQAEAVQ